ncbi:MAG: PspC domain-containing protein [bacterium]|nr:PspC domain-containing protein [bacterium]
MEKIKFFIEKRVFGVCSYIGDRMGISSGKIRLYFIYTSFITMGSPIILYLIIAFWLNIKKYTKPSKNTLWEI